MHGWWSAIKTTCCSTGNLWLAKPKVVCKFMSGHSRRIKMRNESPHATFQWLKLEFGCKLETMKSRHLTQSLDHAADFHIHAYCYTCQDYRYSLIRYKTNPHYIQICAAVVLICPTPTHAWYNQRILRRSLVQAFVGSTGIKGHFRCSLLIILQNAMR